MLSSVSAGGLLRKIDLGNRGTGIRGCRRVQAGLLHDAEFSLNGFDCRFPSRPVQTGLKPARDEICRDANLSIAIDGGEKTDTIQSSLYRERNQPEFRSR